MNDSETLERLLRFFALREQRGGSNALLVEHFRRPPSPDGDNLDSTPELFSFLVDGCRALAREFPGLFRFTRDRVGYDLPDSLEVGSHHVLGLTIDAKTAVGWLKLEIGGEPIPRFSRSDASYLKAAFHRCLYAKYRTISRRELDCYISGDSNGAFEKLREWESKGWIHIVKEPRAAVGNEICLEILTRVDD